MAEGQQFTPRMSPEERNVRRQAWQDAVSRNLGWRRAHLPASSAQDRQD